MYISLDGSWQGIQVLILLWHALQSVVAPIVGEVVVYLVYQGARQWLVIGESGQQSHPVVQLCAFVYCTLNKLIVYCYHFLVVVWDDLNETSHNVREESHAY